MSAEASWNKLRRVSDELRQLSEQVARSVEAGQVSSPGPTELPLPDGQYFVNADKIRSIIRVRRLRTKFFDQDLFADPAWDILLALLEAEIRQVRVTISSLCESAAVPATTALRWITILNDRNLIHRRKDVHDRRRVFAELTPETSHKLRQFLSEATATPI